MRIVFWGSERGCGVTSNMLILASFLACHKGYRITMLEMAPEKCGIRNYFPYSHKKYRKEYIETLIERQLYYVSEEKEESCKSDVIKYLECNMDMVFINLADRTDSAAREMMRNADLLVLNLKQELQSFDRYYAHYANLSARTFLLIGNYFEDRTCDKAYLQTKYRIPKGQLAVIPNNPEYQMACAKGRIVRYICRKNNFWMTTMKSQFLKELERTSQLLFAQIKKEMTH